MKKGKEVLVILFVLIASIFNLSFGQDASPKQILWTTDWSPDGRYIAIGGNVDSLKIYHKESLESYKSFPVENTITRVKWHPSKNLLAVTTQGSTNKSFLLNLDTNEKTELNDISPDGARGVDWNHTGEYLAVADNDGQIMIYDFNGQLVRKFANQEGSTKGITALDWHPKKNLITTVSEQIRFLDMDGNLLKSIKHRQEDVLLLSVAWHKSGDFFVTGDYGYEQVKSLLQFWNEKGELIKTIDISKGEYRNLAWNPKGDRLASASDALRIWDTDGKLISVGSSIDYLWGVSWNEVGNRIITSSMEQRIILWDEKAQRLKTIE